VIGGELSWAVNAMESAGIADAGSRQGAKMQMRRIRISSRNLTFLGYLFYTPNSLLIAFRPRG